ncbi:MAG: hypothetical protein K2K98_10315 [Muribaculaceae bacterium]|nr:hypothetical protein [Muribaculaceae bacterium]
MNQKKDRKTITLHGLKTIIGEKVQLDTLGINLPEDEVVSIKKDNPKYIQPFLFNPNIGVGTDIDKQPQIVLISAPGASGKSWLCDHLSSSIGIPVANLSKCRQVGTHSLTGMLIDAFDSEGYARFCHELKSGRQAFIIDALDEGILKSGMSGFEAFLDDVLRYTYPGSVSIIMLGRPQSVENVALYLDSKNISFSILQIASFSRTQADEFIDTKVAPSNRFQKPYKDLKEYILESIGSFFVQQKEAEESFLGYAPVLDAICIAIKQRNDYNAMLSELKSKSRSGLDIVIDIVNNIVQREKNDKINNQSIKPLENRLTTDQYQRALSDVYTSIEQCKAVLKRVYNEAYEISISEDPSINSEFNVNLNGFIADHPFLINRSFQNIVFESFVLASLIHEDPNNVYLEDYLCERYRDNYMLIFIYNNLYPYSKINPQFISTLYRSFISFDNTTDFASTDIVRIDDEGKHSAFFRRMLDGLPFNAEFSVTIPENFNIDFGPVISNLLLDSDLTIVNSIRKSTEFVAPVTIICKGFNAGGEIYISKQSSVKDSREEQLNRVDICVEKITLDYNKYGTPKIQINSPDLSLNIDCKSKTERPFVDYQTDISPIKTNLTDEEYKVFVKLRKILITFRSHSKGTMARFKDKIEDSRISGNKYGEKIIDRLLETNVVREADNNFYELNREETANVLGLTFDQLKRASMNPKMKEFITSIVDD